MNGHAPPPVAESVEPTSERPLPIVAVLRAPVPFPTKSPVSVVEPVPPKLIAIVEVPEVTPVLLTKRMEFWIPETVRLVVLAVPK